MKDNQGLQEAFYSALIDAFINSRMEKDRSLLALASAGIGLLVTLALAITPESTVVKFLFGASTFCFLLVIVTILRVFHLNTVLVKGLLREEEVADRRYTKKVRRLERLITKIDGIAEMLFGWGLLCTVTLGLVVILS